MITIKYSIKTIRYRNRNVLTKKTTTFTTWEFYVNDLLTYKTIRNGEIKNIRDFIKYIRKKFLITESIVRYKPITLNIKK